jgi:hypothetical protein
MSKTEAKQLIREMRRILTLLEARANYPDQAPIATVEDVAEALNVIEGNSNLLREYFGA